MARIFISYRREDSIDATGRIYDRLQAHFGREAVFMDVDAIPFGTDFRQHLDNAVSQCDILLAVIGEDWLESRHQAGPKQGQRRLDDPADFVTIEIHSALERMIPVIPVLVGRAEMPSEQHLPDILKALAFRHAAEVRSGRDFHAHVDRLIRGIEYLARQERGHTAVEGPRRQEQELARLQWQGEEKLARLVRESLGRTGGRPSSEDNAAANELVRQHRIPKERAKTVIREMHQRWQKERPRDLRSGDLISVSLGSGAEMDFAWVPPGSFLMGSPETEEGRGADEFQHRVTLTKGFYLAVHPVTHAQFTQFVKAAGFTTQAERGSGASCWMDSELKLNPSGNWRNPGFVQMDGDPAVCLSWDDCNSLCGWLTSLGKPGQRFELPTEAEWEYACRAGTTSPFHFGEAISTDLANYDGNYTYGRGRKGAFRQRTSPAGSFGSNAWGLYDMHGNVLEWCQDWYGAYPIGDVTDPTGPESGMYRVQRGGSWFHYPWDCRSANRCRNEIGYRSVNLGCRICLRAD